MKGKFDKLPNENIVPNPEDENVNKKQTFEAEMIEMSSPKPTDDLKTHQKILEEKKPPSHSIEYRPEIDGIRSIAISLVLIFHAWPNFISGGFIGVDVFFVISGYLISSIIFKEISKGQFSFVKFYFRRIRRLFPALIIVMLTVLALGMRNYLPEMLGYLFKTLIASTLFGANIHFYTLGNDYFKDDTTLNPLLHFWSLGVEEQFYIVWPCIAIIVIKNSIRKSTIFIILIFIASFVSSAVTTYTSRKFAFYFPVSRFWQLLLGCSLAYYNFIRAEANIQENITTKCRKITKKIAFNLISLLGFGMILSCALIINETNAFPGFWAIMPSVGSALLIFCEDHALFNKYILSNKILVFIGKISYPLYLWHWPLLVFTRTVISRCGNEHIIASVGTMVLVAVCLSILTYLFVEKNVRKMKGNKIVFVLSLFMILILVFSIVGFYNTDKFSLVNYFSSNNFEYQGHYNKPPFVQRKSISYPTGIEQTSLQKLKYSPGLEDYWQNTKGVPRSSPYYTGPDGRIFNDGRDKKVFFIGDSHAEMAIFRAHHLMSITKPENFPTVILSIKFGSPFVFPCYHEHTTPEDFANNYKIIKQMKPYSVFIASFYDAYINSGPEEEDQLHDKIFCCHVLFLCSCQSRKDIEFLFNEFSRNIKEITDMGIKVFVATLKPEGKEFNPKYMYDSNGKIIEENIKPVRLSEFLKKKSFLYNRLNQAILEGGATIVDYSENLCYDDLCQVLDPYGKPVYKEESHFQNYVVRDYLDVLDQVFGIEGNSTNNN